MTTPSTLSPAEQFRADMMSLLDVMRRELADMYADIDAIQSDIAAIRTGLQQAAAAPAPAGPTETFIADTVMHDFQNSKHAYKLRGGRYTKSGVRIWPEVLATIIAVDACELGETKLPAPVAVRVEIAKRPGKSDLGENPELQYDYAKKIIGKA
jgi:hypothetical protein